jgi:hypothetical protein
MSEKKKVLGFYGMVEFGDYLNRLNPADHRFQMEDPDGRLVECLRPDVLRRFEDFCGGDAEKFRVRIVYTDPATGIQRNSERVLRRSGQSKPSRSRLTSLFSSILKKSRTEL